MPSLEHETLRLLFQNRPELAPALLREALGVDIPPYSSIRVESADLTDIVPAEYRADLVVLLVDGKPVLAIVVEVQLAQDDRKLYTWPVYVVGLRARFECPAAVLVVTSEPAVARWAKRPIAIGPGTTLSPWVIGPDAVPVVTDPKRAEVAPELAVLSVMAHGHDDVDTAVKVALAAMSGVSRLSDRDQYVLYNDLILAALSDAARKALQMIPEGYRYQSPLIRESIEKGLVQGREEGRQEGRQEGREQGLRSTLQRLLTKRYGALPAWAEERVAHATVEQLEIYLETMLTAPGLEEALQLNG